MSVPSTPTPPAPPRAPRLDGKEYRLLVPAGVNFGMVRPVRPGEKPLPSSLVVDVVAAVYAASERLLLVTVNLVAMGGPVGIKGYALRSGGVSLSAVTVPWNILDLSSGRPSVPMPPAKTVDGVVDGMLAFEVGEPCGTGELVVEVYGGNPGVGQVMWGAAPTPICATRACLGTHPRQAR